MDNTMLVQKIKEVDVISFDIFDTLIVRPFCKPTDLFLQIEYDYDCQGFQVERIRAELKVRNKLISKKKPEINLNEIYNEIHEKYKKFKEIEIEYEIKYCLPNNKMIEIYNYVKELKKTIIISSDMYLPKKVIIQILKNAKIDGYDKLYLSNDCMASKADKSMYSLIKNDFKMIDSNKILHIGDNQYTDYDNAILEGIQSFKVIPILEKLAKNLPIYDFLEFIEKNNELGISKYFAVMAITFSNKEINTEIDSLCSSLVLPIVLNMNLELYKYCQKHEIKKVFFASRDGYIFKNNFDVFFRNNNIETEKLFVSRRLTAIPVSEFDCDSSIASWAQGMEGASINELWDNLELNNSVICEKFFRMAEKYDLNNFNMILELYKEFFKEYGDVMKKKYISEKNNFYCYLSEINYFDESNIVVELGWRGSLQNNINKLGADRGESKFPKWFYLGTRDDSYYRIKCDMIGYLLHNGNPIEIQNVIKEGCDYIELIFGAPEYGVKSIIYNEKNSYIPVLQEKNEYEDTRINFSKDIHQINEAFTYELLKYFELKEYQISKSILQILLKKYIQYISQNENKLYANIKVAANFQNKKYTTFNKPVFVNV